VYGEPTLGRARGAFQRVWVDRPDRENAIAREKTSPRTGGRVKEKEKEETEKERRKEKAKETAVSGRAE